MSGGGNWEFEYYTNNRSNSYVRDGVLYLKPTLTADAIGYEAVLNGYTMDLWGGQYRATCTGNAFYGCSRTSDGVHIINPIQSARLRTAESFAVSFNTRVEIRAKLPRGDWLWPALWLLPKDNQYGFWPASGEIDIMESRGNGDGYPGGVRSFGSTLHFGPFYPLDGWASAHAEYTLPSGDLADDFHVYGLLWTADALVTYIDSPSNVVLNVSTAQRSFWQIGGWDGSPYDNPWAGRGNLAPFDQEFYFIFNVACGGTNGYFPDGVGGKPWTDSDPHAALTFWQNRAQWQGTWKGEDAALQVDYIRVWQLS